MNNSLTSRTRQTLIEDVDNLKADARKIVTDVQEHANAHVDETKKRVNDAIDLVRSYATNHPFALIGLGIAFGFLLGIRRRR